MKNAALYVLLIGVMRHYGWLMFEPELRGPISKGLGGLALVALVPFIYRAAPSKAMLLALCWWTFEALQMALCSFAYAIQPWTVPVGQSICSARLDFDMGAIGIMMAAWVLTYLVRGKHA